MTQAFVTPRTESQPQPIRLHHHAASSVETNDHPTPVEATLNKALGLSPEPIPTPDRSSQIRAVSLEVASELPPIDEVPGNLRDRLAMARERLRQAGEHGMRIRVYEVALDLDMSEFHFARQFRSAYGCSPHVYYDEVRAARARDLLRQGVSQGQTARRIGLRRPAELRALLAKRQSMQSMADVDMELAAANG
jgi:AraC-like DNA-binding protein